MLINTHIGADDADGMGIDGAAFQKELLWLDTLGKKSIQIWINSVGGVVLDGMNIYNTMLTCKTPVDTYCKGIAASISAVIFLAGRKRFILDSGILMFHNPSGGDDEKALVKMRESISTTVAARSNREPGAILAIMKKESWLNADEALAGGFATGIDRSAKMNTPHGNSKDARSMYKNFNTIINKILTNNPMDEFKELNLSLGLKEDATAVERATAIKNLQSAAKKVKNKAAKDDDDADGDMTDKLDGGIAKKLKEHEDRIKDLEDSHEKLMDCYNELEDKFGKTENKLTEAETKVKNEAANALIIKNAAKLGNISDDAKKVWLQKAVDDYAGTETILNAIQVNRTSHTIDTATDAKGLKIGSVIMDTMIELKNK
jgi:ATP-dependent Clp protease protease subunit